MADPTQTDSLFDIDDVREHLVAAGELDRGDALTTRLLAGGRSNLTFEIASADRAWVLRRPPAGALLETAHDMDREVKVQRALADSAIPVPRIVYSSSDDDSANGSLYVMEKVDGDLLRTDADFASVPTAQRLDLSRRYIDTLAALHSVDVEAVGLGSFGRPAGFNERQVRRWTKQYDAARTRDLPDVERLAAALNESVPPTSRPGIVHGDFRFDNMIVQLSPTPTIAAVLDWEMSTLGDPLTDLGLVHLFWEGWSGIDNPIAGTPTAQVGYPSFSDLAQRYSMATGADLSRLSWYSAFAFF